MPGKIRRDGKDEVREGGNGHGKGFRAILLPATIASPQGKERCFVRKLMAILLAAVLLAASGCQSGQNQPIASQQPQEAPPAPVELPREEPDEPDEPDEPIQLDYYFMAVQYGVGENPDVATFYEAPDALDRMKAFYQELNETVDRVEYHIQSLLYDGTFQGDAKFAYNGSMNVAGDDGQYHTSLKTLHIGRREYDAFETSLASGRNLEEGDFTVDAVDDVIPVLLGSDYQEVYALGDTLTLSMHLQPLQFTVVGFLQENTTFYFDQEIPLDQYIVVPLYEIAYTPIDAQNLFYQQRYYFQKCDGFVAVDAAADPEETFQLVEDLAAKYGILCAVNPRKRQILAQLPGETVL